MSATKKRNEKVVQSRSQFKPRLILGILLITAVVAVRMVLREDLTFSDEAGYMAGGIRLLSGGRVPFGESPVYSYLYALAAVLFNNTVLIYYVGRALGCVALVLGVMLSTKLLSSWRAAWFAGVITAALAMTYYWPGVSALSTALLLVACALLIRSAAPKDVAGASALLWLAAGVRTEYWPVAGAASLIMIWLAVKGLHARGGDRSAGWAGPTVVATCAALLVLVLLLTLHGLPVGGGRLWQAFGQHYALAHAGPDENPWLGWPEIVAKDFGAADSLVKALAAAPSAFAGHLWRSLLNIPRYAEWSFLDHAGGGLAGTLAVSGLAAALLLVAWVAALVFAWRRRRGEDVRKSRVPAPSPLRLTPVALAAFISLATVLVIWPRLHYLQPWVGAFIIAVAVTADRGLPDRLRQVLTWLTVAVVLVPLFATATYTLLASPPEKPLVNAVERLRSSERDHTLMSNTTGLEVYVPALREAGPPGGDMTFMEYLAQEGIDVAVVDENLRFGTWGELEGYSDFNANPGVFGFAQLEPGAEVWVRMGAVE